MNKSESIKEKWVDVPDYKDFYQVSNYGRVRSLERIVNYANDRLPYRKPGRTLKPISLGNYLGFQLCIDGVSKKKYIHRLVLEAFSDESNWKDTVNHIDGDKGNNKLSNLEWNTYSENNTHSRRVLGNGVFRPIIRINPSLKTDIKEYSTIREAMIDLKLKKYDSNISKYCKLQNNGLYKGYMWRYKEDYKNENIGGL